MANSDMEYSDMSSPSEAQSDPAEKTEGEEDQEETNSALLPKSFFNHDCKPGDVYKVRVAAVHEDEIEVEPVEEEKAETEEGSTMDKAKAGLDRYAQEPEAM